MKILLCQACGDVLRLRLGEHLSCGCEKTQGRYIDSFRAVYTGPCTPFVISDKSIGAASIQSSSRDAHFTAFVPHKDSDIFYRDDTCHT